MKKRESWFVQVVKYGLVGIVNTWLTVVVIYIILFLFSDKNSAYPPSPFLMFAANITGFMVGVANSFLLNRNWTFRSRADWKNSLVRFLMAFAVCYAVQLGVVFWLSGWDVVLKWEMYGFVLTWAYVCQLAGILIYSILNFLLNKYYAFKVNKEPYLSSAE